MNAFFFLAAMMPVVLFGRILLPGGTLSPLFGEFSETVFFDQDQTLSKSYLEFAVKPKGEWPVMALWGLGYGSVAGKLEVGRDVNEDGELTTEEVAMVIDLSLGTVAVDERTGLRGNHAPVLVRTKDGMSVKVPRTSVFWENWDYSSMISVDFLAKNWNCFRLTLNGAFPGNVRASGGWWGDGLRVILF